MKQIEYFMLAAVTILAFNCGGKTEVKNPADLVLINGIIATAEDVNPQAEAVAVKNGKILAVGSTIEIENFIGDSTEVIDLKGKFVMPGFNDSHAHFLGIGNSKMILDLRQAKNWDEVIALVAKAADNAKPGEWIIGRGWHQEKFNPKPNPSVEGYPIHQELSKASPLNPVMLTHASGHAVFVNEKAMQLAGVNRKTANPDGGTIIRDSLGNAVGVFEENAENLIKKVYDEFLAKRTPEQILANYEEQVRLASEDCLKKGITSCSDAGQTFDVIDVLKKFADEKKLGVRLNVMIGDSLKLMKEKLKNYLMPGYADHFLTVRSIKQYIDGALGSRGAWLLEPYTDLLSSKGSNVTPVADLKKIAELAISNGFQMRIHAIGDRGNREVLNLYKEVFKKHPDKKDLRWCIEHVQHLSIRDIPRFAELGVIASMQSVHCTSDMGFVPERLGDKRAEEGAYVWKELINSGAIICNGTDAPVEDVDPIGCFYSSVTRKNSDGKVFYGDQKMSRLQALKTYTINGAYASFEEDVKGSIKTGKYADLVVLSNDLLNCADEDILNTKVLYTIVDGKIKYQAK
ncbi:MAG: amidohydrolase [Ignavibacteriae bacterium HGW-Ignavibacteriae-3]|nr:MAG: amidohydrolase [Ignavibacteriae bacterium HGW-Ignavibacteriae-3]